jgi:hypothetical protein
MTMQRLQFSSRRRKARTYRFLLIFSLASIICGGIMLGSTAASPHMAHAYTTRSSAACPGATSTKPGPNSLLVVLLDRSSSLYATDPDEYSTSVTKILADFWPGWMSVIFISGLGPLEQFGPNNLADSQERGTLKSQIESNRHQLTGYTPLELAMQDAWNLLSTKNFPKGSEVVLITDGAPSIPGDIHGMQQAQNIEDTYVPKFCEQGIPINAFGLKIDQTTQDGQRAYELLNYIADHTKPAGLSSVQYYDITNPAQMADPIIKLIAQWRGLKLQPATKSAQGQLYAVNIDTYASQAYIVAFHSTNAVLLLKGADQKLVPDAAFKEHLTDVHYDFYNLSGKRFSTSGRYSVDTTNDPAASVFALEDTRLQVEPIAPVTGTTVSAEQPLTISAAFYDGNDPNNHAFLSPGTGSIVATFSLVVNGKTVFKGSKKLLQQQKPHDDLYSEQITPPQTGTLTITYTGTVEDVQIAKQSGVAIRVDCAILDLSCYWQEYHTGILAISIPAIILILLFILLLLWFRQPAPCGTIYNIQRPRPGNLRPDPEDDIEVRLGSKRTLRNRLFHRSVITSTELLKHPDAHGNFDFDSALFELVAKHGKLDDEEGSPSRKKGCIMYIRPAEGNVPSIKVKTEKQLLTVMNETPLASGSIIFIDGVPRASYS